ncbi:MAG TPA: class I SAM-dependent RNA methyltransferase [Amycolatopsis sp.]|nr:class I SAM-dependent RNA methyltransferase [Amycolatopsis sp.]
MTENWSGRTLELEIGPVAHGGHCVSRVDGRVVFVRHGLPGERVRAVVTEDKGGSFCRADAVEILVASEHRGTPPCPLAAPGGCGGCDWQHADPGYQRSLKAAVVAEQLRRLAGLERDVVVEPLDGGPLGWRSRVRLVAGRDGRVGLREHHSHHVVSLDTCPIAVPGMLDVALAKRWRPGAEVEVTSDGDGHTHVRELNTVHGRTRSREVSGGVAVQHAAGRDWHLDAHGFWQVHPFAAETFAQLVGEWAEAPCDGVAWDLYAGVGLFASVLAAQVGPGGRVLAVESGRRAVSDGEENLADLPQVSWRAGRVEHALAHAPKPVDVVVLDPPRKGAGRAVVEAIAAGQPDRIVYVACDPAALARDLATFAEHGYSLTELRAFDAFPMTHHVECVALLQ